MEAMDNLDTLTISSALESLEGQKTSPQELATACHRQIQRLNPALNAFITVIDPQEALKSQLPSTGDPSTDALRGIPIALKDLFDTAGIRTTAGSTFFADHVPDQDAFVVEKQETDAAQPRGRGVAGFVARRRPLVSYDSYLAARNLAPGTADRRGGAGIAATVHHRERDADIGFVGARCRRCRTVHFPAQRVCYGCHAKDDFERERLSGGRGRVMSYSFDHFFPTPEPPLITTMVETDQGCRVYLQMTDARPEELRCDLAVEFVFRRIHEAGGKPNYFWKCTPLRGEPCFSD